MRTMSPSPLHILLVLQPCICIKPHSEDTPAPTNTSISLSWWRSPLPHPHLPFWTHDFQASGDKSKYILNLPVLMYFRADSSQTVLQRPSRLPSASWLRLLAPLGPIEAFSEASGPIRQRWVDPAPLTGMFNDGLKNVLFCLRVKLKLNVFWLK